jgi:hypothetical protein
MSTYEHPRTTNPLTSRRFYVSMAINANPGPQNQRVGGSSPRRRTNTEARAHIAMCTGPSCCPHTQNALI